MPLGRQLAGKEVTNKVRDNIGLPRPLFMFTLDQVLTMLQMKEDVFIKKTAWLQGREIGNQPRDRLRCVNISARTELPEWRIEESEFVRWAQFHHFTTYERFMQ